MTISARKLKALCKKDFMDFFKNPSIFVSVLIPILFIILYKNLNIPNLTAESRPQFLLNMGTLFNCSMSGIMIASTSIAEEKEKFTLRTLMLSNVSGFEFLLSKLSIGFLVTTLGNIVIFFLSGTAVHNLPVYLLVTALGVTSLNLISAVVGIMSRDQMSCGVLQIPAMLLFLLPSVFSGMHSALKWLARVTPLNAMMRLYYYGEDNMLFCADSVFHFIVLSGWIAASAIVFALVYKKKGLDN